MNTYIAEKKKMLTHWTQISFILIGIGYVVFQFLIYNLKRKEIRFNTFHAERGKFIREFYIDLLSLGKELDSMHLAHFLQPLNMGPTKEEWKPLFHRIIKKSDEIKTKYDKNRILFPERFCKKLDNLMSVIFEELIETSLDKSPIVNDESQDLIFNNSDRYKSFYENDYPTLKKELEKEFRKYL